MCQRLFGVIKVKERSSLPVKNQNSSPGSWTQRGRELLHRTLLSYPEGGGGILNSPAIPETNCGSSHKRDFVLPTERDPGLGGQ